MAILAAAVFVGAGLTAFWAVVDAFMPSTPSAGSKDRPHGDVA